MKKLFSFLLLFSMLSCFMAGSAAAESAIVGRYLADEVQIRGFTMTADEVCESLGLEAGTLLAFEIYEDGHGQMMLKKTVYPVSLQKLEDGSFALTASEEHYILEQAEEGLLLCRMDDGVSVTLRAVKKLPLPMGKGVQISAVLEESEAAVRAEADREQEMMERLRKMLASLNFKTEDTDAMSRYMLHGRYWFDGSVMYGMAFDKKGGLPSLICSEIGSIEGGTPLVGAYVVLDRHVNANYLTPVGNALYYIRVDRETGTSALARLDLATLETEMLTAPMPEMSFLQIHNGRVFFAGKDYHYYSCDMEGNDLQLVLDKEVREPYFIASGFFLYQDVSDGLALHLFCTATGEDLAVTEKPAFHPVLAGQELFFTTRDAFGAYRLSRLTLTDLLGDGSVQLPKIERAPGEIGEEFGITNNTVYCSVKTSVPLKEWKTLAYQSDREEKTCGLYYGPQYLVMGDLASDGERIEMLSIVDAGTGLTNMFRHVY